jgi:predicted nuclease of predicted toxin-antitoxin system
LWIWVDAQLPPALASLLRSLGTAATHVEELGLLMSEDPEIFRRARDAQAVVATKDADFLVLLERFGPPPQVLWVTCGNFRNRALLELVRENWEWLHQQLASGEPLVEIGRRPTSD